MAATIDHGTPTRLVKAGTAGGARIVGQNVSVVRHGTSGRPLAAQRTRQGHLFLSADPSESCPPRASRQAPRGMAEKSKDLN